MKVIALLAAYNEADIIEQVLKHLLAEGVLIYFIDDGSTDATVSLVEPYLGRGVLQIERRPPASMFDWCDILRRKQALAASLDADWFVHHDADEFRESPWPTVGLAEAFDLVDRHGYNAIQFDVLNFRPTVEQPVPADDIRQALPYYERAESFDRLQIKAWRKHASVDLVSSGGHEAKFEGRRVYPLRFLTRHYPIRSLEHGRRKVFNERLPRYLPDERARGWHMQYDADRSIVRVASELTRFDAVESRAALTREVPANQREMRDLADERDHLATENATLLGALVEERAQRLSDTSAHHAEVSRLRAEHDVERSRLQDAHQRTLDGWSLTHSALRDELRRRVVELNGADSALSDLHASASWRITAPLRGAWELLARVPAGAPAGTHVQQRLRPASDRWGADRGLPVDRYYIHAFLNRCRSDIRGRVLEVKDSGYTIAYGGNAVTDAQVLDVNAANPHATIVSDLSALDKAPESSFDCFILTQTLHVIYDIRGALLNAARLLKPGGVLLCTLPAVSRVSDEDGGLESGDYWRMTAAAVRRLFAEAFGESHVEIATHGNVRVCSAFLYGWAAEDLTDEELNIDDPWFPLIHCVRASRPR